MNTNSIITAELDFIIKSNRQNPKNINLLNSIFLNSKFMDLKETKDDEDSPREHLPEDKDPNEKPHPVRDPDDKDLKKDKPKKEDYLPEGGKRYIKEPTREADSSYLPGHEDDLENDKAKRSSKDKPED